MPIVVDISWGNGKGGGGGGKSLFLYPDKQLLVSRL